MPPRLPVHRLKTNATELNLGGTTKVYHLPDWHRLTHPQRLTVIRQIAMMRGRDPRIAKLAVSILKKAGAAPRQYEAQAAALLKWVQDPKNVYYVNEPGERLQDPIYTIKAGHGDCDDQVLLLTCLFESVGLPWRLVLSGMQGQQKLRYIEGSPVPEGVAWSHIYCMVGTPPFRPKKWHFCETTVQGVPLGWDVVAGDHKYLPEMGGSGVAKLPKQQPLELGDAAAGMVSADLVRQYQANQAIDWLKIGVAVTTGVAVSVFTSLALDYINGRGIWEGRGHVLKRVKHAAEPTVNESVFVHPSPLDF